MFPDRRRKKRQGKNIKKEYKLELDKVNGSTMAEVVDKEIAPAMAKAGVKMVILDNDRKAHMLMCRKVWAKHGIDVHFPIQSLLLRSGRARVLFTIENLLETTRRSLKTILEDFL